MKQIAIELSRTHNLGVLSKVLEKFRATALSENAPDGFLNLALSSCYLLHPEALKFRRDLVRQEKVKVEAIIGNPRCKLVGRDRFQDIWSKLPISNLYYFREGDQDFIQFLDPVVGLAFSRGFGTQYHWTLGFAGSAGKPLAEGQISLYQGGNGSVKLNLQKSSKREFLIPFGEKLSLKVQTIHIHPQDFKELKSEKTEIQFVLHPWFEYVPEKLPKVRVVYPLPLLELEKQNSREGERSL